MPNSSLYTDQIKRLLVRKAIGDTLSDTEQDMLTVWGTQSAYQEQLLEQVGNAQLLASELNVVEAIQEERIWKGFIAMRDSRSAITVHRVHFLKTGWFRYAALLILIAGSATLIYRAMQKSPQRIAQNQPLHQSDIQPGGNKAILTLSDGNTITLDSAANGSLARQGNSNVIKLSNGQVRYEAVNGTQRKEAAIVYNTISTPKGGQYQIVLPDGSKVWLNAASSIRFPTAFTTDRTVEITGESYLEVAGDKARPFFVKTAQATIQVLGTSFNVNNYPDESAIKTTLMEGSVKVVKNTNGKAGVSFILKPGQQAVVKDDIQLLTNVNTRSIIAWKEGWLSFDNADLAFVMRQLSRWYNIDVQYPRGIPKGTFNGKIDRSLSLREVMEGLADNKVNYTITNNRTIIITP